MIHANPELDLTVVELDAFRVIAPAFYSGHFEVISEDNRVVPIECSRIRESATFTVDGRQHTCVRTGFAGWDFRLRVGVEEIAVARRNLTFRRYTIVQGDVELELRSGSRGWTPFFLLREGRRIGRLDRISASGGTASANLPSSMEEPMRIFTIYLAIVAWRRIAGTLIGALVPG
jgi:hypothetical protein